MWRCLPPLFVAYCTKMDVRERSSLRWPSNNLLFTEEISWHIYCSILATSLFGLMRQAQIGEISSGNLAILWEENQLSVAAFSLGEQGSLMCAMTSDGVLEYEATTGSINADKFMDSFWGCLIPNMQPFPAKHSILILDNCSIHHAHDVTTLPRSFGILVLFLPPYSPIEELFSYIKYYLKAHDDIIEAVGDPLPIIHSAFQSVSKSQCDGWINHSGYSH